MLGHLQQVPQHLILQQALSNVRSLAVSPGGELLIAGGDNGTIRCWRVATLEEMWTTSGLIGGFDPKVTGIVFTKNGRHFITFGYDHRVRVFETATQKEIGSFRDHLEAVMGVALSPDGRFAISCGFDKTVRVWHMPVEAIPPK